ncbi:hypothetical protein CRG98_012223 [Punica granatum]|uniref:Uncharacterized protein n=1 Tax=Punica granatum TaxID=22663 RepID=A0A2I0KHU3_PUNGR|nr:hypothetical protein CRG98_012223 [Punica granatum]
MASGDSFSRASVARPREDIPVQEPYLDDKVPWTYEGGVGNLEQQFGVLGITRSGRVYENPAATDKGKAPAVEIEAILEVPPTPPKKVTEEEAEAFMKIVKASEYKVVEHMAKSLAHISLLALLLSSEPHREALLRVLTSAQVPKETPPDRIEETVSSIFSNTVSFSDDELPSEGWTHSRALHIVCKCNNHIIGRVMIDNGSALNVCSMTTLKQMNVDLNRVRPSKTAESFCCATITFPAPALGHADKGSTAPSKSKNTKTGGDSTFAPPSMRSLKPAGATTSIASPLCAPEFHLVGARMREAYATRLESVHLPGDARRTRVRRSRHLLFTTRRSRAVESPGSRGTRFT